MTTGEEFEIEDYIRILSKSKAFIIGIFDCCRVKAAPRGKGDGFVFEADNMLLIFGSAPKRSVDLGSKLGKAIF